MTFQHRGEAEMACWKFWREKNIWLATADLENAGKEPGAKEYYGLLEAEESQEVGSSLSLQKEGTSLC